MSTKTFTAGYRVPLFIFLALALMVGCGDSRQLSDEQLDRTIMFVESERGAPQDWMTLREWKDKLGSQPKVLEVEDHFPRDAKSFGFEIEIQDKDKDLVFMFQEVNGKLHPSHIGGDDSVVYVSSGMGKFLAAAMIKGTVAAKK